jgi:hypothetical protein
MNKKLNTVLFMLAATVLNIVMMITLLILLVVLAGVLFPDVPATTGQILLIAAFLLALGGSFALYTFVMRWITRKIDMDRYFHPIFKQRSGRRPPR